MTHDARSDAPALTRRELLHRCGLGMGAVALANLMGRAGMVAEAQQQAVNPLTPRSPLFPGKAKRVLHIFANGGPSQVDTFDPKPALEKYAGKPLPKENLKTEGKIGTALPLPYKFNKYDQSSINGSENFPNLG